MLTDVAKLPKDAERQLADPFGEKKSPWPSVLLLLALLAGAAFAWHKGYIGPKPETPPAAAEAQTKAEPANTEPATPAPAKPADTKK